MHLRTIIVSGAVAGAIAACHRSPPAAEVPNRPAERTVFTDSALHAENCLPNKAGEDWHRVCTPVDQAVRHARPKPPERP